MRLTVSTSVRIVLCMDTTPAAAITDRQIRRLREGAIAAGDYDLCDLCDRALADDTVDQDGNEIPFAEMSREDARLACAKAIADAEAQS